MDMKLVREHINEKFTEDSNPILDLGVGVKRLIVDWCKNMNIRNFIINDD
jgi:hypothetical protein